MTGAKSEAFSLKNYLIILSDYFYFALKHSLSCPIRGMRGEWRMSTSYYMQHMLLQYGRQLTTARRIARHRQAMRLTSGEEPSIPAETRRRVMVERVTGEVVENLLLAGSDSSIVTEVRERLEEELGTTILFRYPPGELDMRIYRRRQISTDSAEEQHLPSDRDAELEEILGEDKMRIMDTVWRVAREIVDETML